MSAIPRTKRVLCKNCGKDRLHEAHGLCKPCYLKEWRELNPEKAKQSVIKSRNKNRKKTLEAYKMYKKNNPEKDKAHRELYAALRKGKLFKPSLCDLCEEKSVRYAHHNDYSKPLEVKWVCSLCHADIHSKAKGKKEKEEF